MWMAGKICFFKYFSSFAPESCFSSEKLREFLVHNVGVDHCLSGGNSHRTQDMLPLQHSGVVHCITQQ